jgi:hypothetical protein
MMADHDEPDAADLASAYLDGEASDDERARVEGDPALLAEVERLRRVRAAVAEVPPASAAARDAAVAAALAAFDELHGNSAPAAPTNVVPLEHRRRVQRTQAALTAVAAAAVLVIGGFIIANRGGDDDATTARQQPPAVAPAADESVASEALPSAAPTTTGVSTTAVAADVASAATVSELEAADAPLAAAPSELVTEASASDAAAPAAAATPLVVVRDADDLRAVAESLDPEPPSDAAVVATCERQPPAMTPDAEFAEADGTFTPVAVASTSGGYAAISLDDCTVLLRAPT